jgi:DNA-binding transcriptional LysR family regulator
MEQSATPDLNEIVVFARVVQVGSFVGAAKQLGMPKSTVSRKVSGLEDRLGVRLLHRTTRRSTLTDEGRAYYEHAARIVAEIERAEVALSRLSDEPRGRLRITTPLDFGHLGPIVASFARRWPDVQIEVVGNDAVVDLIADGFDVAIRAGPLTDSSLVARALGVLRSYVVASPELVAARSPPSHPRELSTWPSAGLPIHESWTLQRDGERQRVPVHPRIVSNNFEVISGAALGGVAMALLPEFLCAPALRDGTLVRLLPDWCSPPTAVHVVVPSAHNQAPKVRVFVDHLVAAMHPPPWAP